MLSVNNISVGYKGLAAVQGVSFHVDKGEVVSLVGSNGAGEIHHPQDYRRPSSSRGRRDHFRRSSYQQEPAL